MTREDWRLSNNQGHPSHYQVCQPLMAILSPTHKELRHNSDFSQFRAWIGIEPGDGIREQNNFSFNHRTTLEETAELSLPYPHFQSQVKEKQLKPRGQD